MGNLNSASQMSNLSKRNVRVFITEKAEDIDYFISSQSGDDKSLKNVSVLPQDKKFNFKTKVECHRVLASQTQEVPFEADRFVSIFVEDADDEKICSKQIMHNMQLKAPATVLLYDV